MPARKPKPYVGRVYLGQDAEGKQLWHWVGRFERKRDRDAAVARARTEKPWQQEAAPDEWTVDAWCDRYIARMESGDLRPAGGRRYKDSSIDAIRWRLRALRKEFGPKGLSTITRVEAEDWAARVPGNAVAAAVTVMEAAVRAELVERNRFKGLSSRSEGRKHERPPSEEEMLLLLDGCSALGDDYAPMMRSLLTFAAFTLMRPGELFALDWEDLDLSAGANGRATWLGGCIAAGWICRRAAKSARSHSPRPPGKRSTRYLLGGATTPTGWSFATRPAGCSPSPR